MLLTTLKGLNHCKGIAKQHRKIKKVCYKYRLCCHTLATKNCMHLTKLLASCKHIIFLLFLRTFSFKKKAKKKNAHQLATTFIGLIFALCFSGSCTQKTSVHSMGLCFSGAKPHWRRIKSSVAPIRMMSL